LILKNANIFWSEFAREEDGTEKDSLSNKSADIYISVDIEIESFF